MKRIPLEQAKPGMVLAKPVVNSAGMIVVAAGMALDESLLTHLERMGTAVVYVEGAAGDGEIKSLEDLERELDARFRKLDEEPQLSRIRQAIRRHLQLHTEASHD
jgi:hypothetical protein